MSTTPIDPTQAGAAAGLAAPNTTTPTLGQDDFLKLFIAKLENQDPLSPSEDTEFIAELATFSSLEQLINVNGNLQGLSLGQTQLLNAQSLDLIGKSALISSDGTLNVTSGVAEEIVYELPEGTRTASLRILDAQGKELRSITLDPSSQGRVSLAWDGMIDDPNDPAGPQIPISDGDYQIEIIGTNVDGDTLSASLYRSLPIDGMSFEQGLIQLISGHRTIPMETIVEFRSSQG